MGVDLLGIEPAPEPYVPVDDDYWPGGAGMIDEGVDVAIRAGALSDEGGLVARRVALFTVGLYATPQLLRAQGEPLHVQMPVGICLRVSRSASLRSSSSRTPVRRRVRSSRRRPTCRTRSNCTR